MKSRPLSVFVGTLLFAIGLLALRPASAISSPSSDASPLDWLKDGNYAALDDYYSQQQQNFEAGSESDEALYQSFRKLYEDSVDNERRFDGWIDAFPNSYVARVARGVYLYRMGYSVRGDRPAAYTSRRQFASMANWLVRARPDLITSLTMTPKPYLSALYLMNVDRLMGRRRKAIDHWLDVGVAADPDNTLIRVRYMDTLRPRWAGSYQSMQAFLQQCQQQQLSPQLLAKLEIVIHTDLAEQAMSVSDSAKSFDEWKRVIDLSATAGEAPVDEAVIGYTEAAQALHRTTEAEQGLRQLSDRQFNDPWSLSHAGWAFAQANRDPEAWPLLLKAAEMNDAWSQFTVGKEIYNGEPTLQMKPDQAAGLIWISRSADQCFADAVQFMRAHQLPGPAACRQQQLRAIFSTSTSANRWVAWTLAGLLLALIALRIRMVSAKAKSAA